jgi:chemotaxis protein methyltransferase CheR
MAAQPEFLTSWNREDGNTSSFMRPVNLNATFGALDPELFASFQGLIYAECGVWLHPGKSATLAARLAKRLHALGLGTLKQYYRYVSCPDHAEERGGMLDAVLADETHFFRDPAQFEFLAQRLFPRWQEEAAGQQRPRRIRVWSAGCGNGEEPFSLAMLLLRFFPPQLGWDLEVLASDISRLSLQKAQEGVWPLEKSADIPRELLNQFMLKGSGEQAGWMKAAPELTQIVRFSRLNLLNTGIRVSGIFDIIFCRHVLPYFDAAAKTRVLANLCRHLSPTGFLFVGRSEEVDGVCLKLKSMVPSIYAEVGESGKFLYDFRAR